MKQLLLLIWICSMAVLSFGQDEVSTPIVSQTKERGEIRCLFFFIPDCPACRNNMQPLMRLKTKYQNDGLKIEAILSDPSPSTEKLAKTIEEHKLYVPIVYDTLLTLAKKYGVTTTPQLILLNDRNQIVYSGCLDNYYYRFGKHRSSPNKFYLEDAIEATLNNRLPDVKFTEPVGCKINFN